MIPDFVGGRDVAEGVNCCKKGVLAEVHDDEYKFGEPCQFLPFHLLLESPCLLFWWRQMYQWDECAMVD